MDEINTFNINGRYDDYKFKFLKKATYDYTENYYHQASILYVWLKQQLEK